MPDKHALYGPSNSSIWLNCPHGVQLSSQFKDRGSTYAAEGTRAHALCEFMLRRLNHEPEVMNAEPPSDIDDEMVECATAYRDFVEEELNAARAKTKDAKLMVEVQFDLSEYVPDSFGTSDAVIVSDTMLEVIDFKYGKGVTVNPINNSQLRLYALGAYTALGNLYDFTTVKTTVFQPRVQNIGSEELSVQELLDWALDFVKPRAELAMKAEGDFVVGDHCRFCRAAGACRARAEEAFKVIDRADTKPALLTDEEIPAILDKLDNAEKWIAAVRAYAENKAVLEGKKWEGYKLVEGKTNRKITDQLRALNVLNKEGYSNEDVTTVKLKGITDLERLLGKPKFNEVLGPLVVKPQGAPQLVKDTDKRPEINPIENVFKEEN